MDNKLFEAARTGNVGALSQLLKEHPLVLHAVALRSGETPLHVASMVGHLNFVKEMIKLKPEFAGKLSQDGFCPLHLASANGYLEITRELLKIDPTNHCRLKSSDRRTALHLAVINGTSDVIKELLISCPESIEDVTFGGATVLHLAVMNQQFEALEVIVEWLKQLNKASLLNRMDEQGNTVLHLATYTKQREVVQLLLGKDAVIFRAIEVNVMNECNLTALDIVQMFPREVGSCWYIEKTLLSAGAKRAQDITSLAPPVPVVASIQVQSEELRTSTPSPLGRIFAGFMYQEGRDSPSQVRSDLLVIAVLIATTTYQAILNPPGGVWQDDSFPSSTNTSMPTSTVPHSAGTSILGTKSPYSFALFLFCNATGFHLSIFILSALSYGFPLRLELQICMFVMAITYYDVVSYMSPGGLTLGIIIFSGVFPLSLPFIFFGMRPFFANWGCLDRNATILDTPVLFFIKGIERLHAKWRRA